MTGFYGGTPGHSNIISLKASKLNKSVSENMAIGEKVIIESSNSQINGTIWEKINNTATQSAEDPEANVEADFFFVGKLKGVKGDKNSVYKIIKNISVTAGNYNSFLTAIANALSSIIDNDDDWIAQKTILAQGTITNNNTSVPFERLVILKTRQVDNIDGEVVDLGPTNQYIMVSNAASDEENLQKIQAGRKVFKYKPI